MVGRRLLTAAVLVGLTLAAGGCDKDQPEPSKSTTSLATAPAPVNQPQGALADLVEKSCVAEGKVWNFQGKLKNSTMDDRNYKITISIAKQDGGTVVSSKELVQRVAAGKEAPVEAKSVYSEGVEGLTCVIGVTLN